MENAKTDFVFCVEIVTSPNRGNETGEAESSLNCSIRKINYLNECHEDYLIITNITKNKNKLKIKKTLCRRKPPTLMQYRIASHLRIFRNYQNRKCRHTYKNTHARTYSRKPM